MMNNSELKLLEMFVNKLILKVSNFPVGHKYIKFSIIGFKKDVEILFYLTDKNNKKHNRKSHQI